jgi:predicted GIY-YIG superfamily endonuclease
VEGHGKALVQRVGDLVAPTLTVCQIDSNKYLMYTGNVGRTEDPHMVSKLYWVYVIQSLVPRTNKRGKSLPGFFYVGMTTDPARRLREHNGIKANGEPGLKGGGKYTSNHRPWIARALYGPFGSRSDALRAEYALKRQKRGEGRLRWTVDDSPWCRGEGVNHPWVTDPVGWRPPIV